MTGGGTTSPFHEQVTLLIDRLIAQVQVQRSHELRFPLHAMDARHAFQRTIHACASERGYGTVFSYQEDGDDHVVRVKLLRETAL